MIRRMMIAAAALIAAPVAAQTAPMPNAQPITYIHAGTLIAVPGEAPRRQATVIVRDGRIAEVRDGFVPPEVGAELVDLSDRTVLPGLIDMHVHLYSSGDPLQARLNATREDYESAVLTAAANARATLMAGFTTVRDLGGEGRGLSALAEAIAAGRFDGPTIVHAGRMVSVSGGHGDANGVNRMIYEGSAARQTHVCDGPDDCRRAVRAQIREGAEVIKFAATGGVLSQIAGGLNRQMSEDEMRAIVETAHSFGRRVTAHAHGKDGIDAALRAGVDSIEHGSFIDDETVRLFRERRAFLVPTMIAPVTALANARAGATRPETLVKAEQAGAAAAESHARAVRAGVRIAFGTDTGVSVHGRNAEEFALMVRAGMTPAAAIRAATVDAAELLDRSATLGAIEPGKTADIIAVAGDPLADVRALERVEFVMRQGQVFREAE